MTQLVLMLLLLFLFTRGEGVLVSACVADNWGTRPNSPGAGGRGRGRGGGCGSVVPCSKFHCLFVSERERECVCVCVRKKKKRDEIIMIRFKD